MKQRKWLGLGALGALSAAAGLLSACTPDSSNIAGVPDAINYNWHVRPILSENCFQCHGPDPESLEANLRLDDGQLALQRLEGPRPRFAIVPGDPDSSELIRRINTTDDEEVMPPQSTHKTLTEAEKQILRSWIDDGAEYQQHWAFVPPERLTPPATELESRVINEIDRFAFRNLERAEIGPSPEADRETLINRISLTLTGMPPTLDAVDAFVADERPGAYSEMVDELLASPRYAEHMSAYWMDLARWSETDGFLDDHHDRWLWPWRDWVISAFNDNMPFDQFGTWQLAGDLLPDATREQILATAFLRVGKRTTENGAIDEEYKAEYMIERTDNALGTAFMGLTLGCARCHDHKYDPIRQYDYYSLGAFFNSNDEPGVYGAGFSGIQGGPTLDWPETPQQSEEVAALAAELARAEQSYSDALANAAPRVRTRAASVEAAAATIESSLSASLAAYYPFETVLAADLADLPPPRPPNDPPRSIVRIQRNPYGARQSATEANDASLDEQTRARRERDRLLLGVPRNYVQDELMLSPAGSTGVADAVIQGPILEQGVRGQALFFDETNKGFLGTDVGWYDNQDAFSFDFWFMPAAIYEKVPVINHRTEQNSGSTGYSLEIEDGHLMLRLAHSPPANMIALRSDERLPIGEWAHIAFTYDGSSRAAGTRIYLNGQLMPTSIVRDTLTRTFLPWSSADVFEQFVGVAFGTRFRAKAPVGSALDELRVYDKALTPLEVAFLHDEDVSQTLDAEQLASQLAAMLLHEDAEVAAAFAALTAARGAHNRAVSVVPQVLVMRDAPEPIPTFVLNRGLYSNPGEQVMPRGLEAVYEWDEDLPKNRLGLARWLFNPENPLIARVFVNRIWQMHFGRGLVETSEDFGSQGAIPSHPELLDWLATHFIDSGWDIKALHRLIVNSATYKQTSNADDELLARDASNTLLARGPRWRMTAEMVRDSALTVSGLLSSRVGGQSAKPYQPDGIWNPTNSFYTYPDADSMPADEHHRRTLYTFVKRNALHPTLTVFDFTNRTESRARRRSSNTPLQALTLMNDPQYVEAYRALASKTLRAAEALDEQLGLLYRMATRATPSPSHIDVLREFYETERAAYAGNPSKTNNLLQVGVTDPDSSLDPISLAAMTQVAGLVMNSPDAYMVR